MGIPAAIGAYMYTNSSGGRGGAGTAIALLMYAGIVTLLFAFFIPKSYLGNVNYGLHMPVSFVFGCVLGGAVGFVQRSKGS